MNKVFKVTSDGVEGMAILFSLGAAAYAFGAGHLSHSFTIFAGSIALLVLGFARKTIRFER
jgi:hypothetical protein